jgi:hypothetical protein
MRYEELSLYLGSSDEEELSVAQMPGHLFQLLLPTFFMRERMRPCFYREGKQV